MRINPFKGLLCFLWNTLGGNTKGGSTTSIMDSFKIESIEIRDELINPLHSVAI